MSRSKSSNRRYTSARERAEKQGSGFTAPYLKLPDGVALFKPKTGTMLIDILPFEAGEGNPWADKGALHWERTIYVHRGVGANSDSYLCPRMTSKSRCPICEHRSRLMKENDEDNEELIKNLSPKQRQLFNVINLKATDKGIQIWDMSYHLFGKVLDARLRNSDEEDEWDKFFFLDEGLVLKIGFAEKSFGGVTFNEVETIDFKQRKEQYDDDMLEQVHCLDDVLIELDYEELKKRFLETEKDEDDDDDDEEERPKSKGKSSKRDTDDEDDEDEKPRKKSKDDDEEDDEDDEKPKSKKKSKDDEDDDWDDFDEDDDKKSKKKSKDEDDDDAEGDEEPPKKKRPADEEEEEEPPKKKKSKDDDDDDDWDDDKGDEDEPKKKSKSKDHEDDEDEDAEDDEKPRKKNRFAKQKGDRGWDKPDDDDDDEPKKKKSSKDDDDE